MGLVKAHQAEQAEQERRDEVRAWLKAKTGRSNPTDAQIDRAWDDFELDEALLHAMDRDD